MSTSIFYENNNIEWYRSVKNELIKGESKLLLIRKEKCTQIVNESIKYINMELNINNNDIKPYTCQININEHLRFLMEWKGLHITTQTKDSYIKKSKNWLNGRRAPVYGNDLFPAMILSIENYVNDISYTYFNNDHERLIYVELSMLKILKGLSECKLSLSHKCKQSTFFCLNSIKKKSKLRQILQNYAKDHPYNQGFPSCFEAARDYFDNKYKETLIQLTNKSKVFNNNDIIIQNENTINFSDTDSKADTTTIINDLDTEIEFWKQKTHEVANELQQESLNRKTLEIELDMLKDYIQRQSNNNNRHNYCIECNHQTISNNNNLYNVNNNNSDNYWNTNISTNISYNNNYMKQQNDEDFDILMKNKPYNQQITPHYSNQNVLYPKIL